MMKRKLLYALGCAVIVLALLLVAKSYFLPAPAPTVTLAGISYSVQDSDIGALVDNEETRAALDRHLPGISTLRQLDVARPLTLEDIRPFYPDVITPQRLQQLDAELADIKGSAVEVYTTKSTLVGVILDDPPARDIVDTYLPGFSTNPQIDQGRGFTLSFMQKFDREVITDEVLANIDRDFEALAKQRAGIQ